VKKYLLMGSLSILTILFVASKSSGLVQLCGTGEMEARIDTIPPCGSFELGRDTLCGRHFGDILIPLIDCVTGDTIGVCSTAVHVLPPCPHPCPSLPSPFPPAGQDIINNTIGEIKLTLFMPPLTEMITVGGDLIIDRKPPNPNCTIQTEMLQMELTGVSLLGPVRVRAGSNFGLPPSPGTITSMLPNPPCDFPAIARFDPLHFEITIGECETFDDLDLTIAGANIDNEGVRNSLQSKANNARKQFDKDNLKTSGNVLCALLHEVDAQDGKHIHPVSAQGIRDCVESLAANLGIPLPCDTTLNEISGVETFSLRENEPNPFHGTTLITYQLPTKFHTIKTK